ncbi:BglG family transcription antiterminator [Listeria monocytogenes]|uniref:BglG family transcription antiterminator n=1 Tax=Listeria monocytogenes TaxID=1639 RepID=UPI000F11DAF0|nr:BglG family transcription antiterminator [Listeria monocytogenes]MCY62237.1 HTH domain-containing protein [Listeria monocytogenes serotype 4c]EAC5533026.1 BglG family transcription antiterminator [Listeria monocytogenes]EAC7121898.1 BglG family transcription antiterminator [Listeria monocytogenes]EAC9919961.1 BglG family transcription antiterminator [Listeria monocytogenes]EAD0700706.1 BglG family transcription antiterminator [Listeria monocytogenes]
MLNQRQKNILSTLYNENNWLLGKKLADLFQISDRTIRNDIRVIKESIGDDFIFTSKKLGYAYNMEKPFPIDVEAETGFEQNRMAQLIQQLLVEEGVDIYEYGAETFTSESTIQRDIQWLRGYFEQLLGLDVVIHSSDGVYAISASPTTKMELLNRIATLDEGLKTNLLTNCFPEINHEKIRQILLEMIHQHKIVLKYFDETILLAQLIYGSAFFQKHAEQQTSTKIANPFLKQLFDTIQQEMGYQISAEMKQFIVSEYEKIVAMNHFENQVTTKMVLEGELYQEILLILEEIKHVYLIDFTADLDVTSDMTKHIFIALERAKRGIVIKNQVTHIITQQYSYLLDIAIFIGEKLLERLGVILNQEEIILLVMYLYQYYRKIEAKHQLNQVVRIALIVLEGKAAMYYLREQLAEVLRPVNAEVIEITDNSQCQLLLAENIDVDLCISTKKIDLPAEVPCIILANNIGLIEEVTIKKQLSATVEANKMKKFAYIKEKYLHEELFLTDYAYEQKYNAIEFLSQYCIDKEYVPERFTEKLYNREQLFSTAIPTGIALPHPIKNVARKSGIFICILKKPCAWDTHKVSLIMIPMIEELDGAEAPLINDFLSIIASNKSYVEQISACSTYRECVELLQTIYNNNE